jgi:hypothetical protein
VPLRAAKHDECHEAQSRDCRNGGDDSWALQWDDRILLAWDGAALSPYIVPDVMSR